MKQKRWTLVLLAALLTALAAAAGAETLDEYFTCRFSWSPAVYTGPGGTYFRAGNGKAQYGSPGQARVYGTENGWLLIGYQTGGGQYRRGAAPSPPGFHCGDMAVEKNGRLLDMLRHAHKGALTERNYFSSAKYLMVRTIWLV